MTLQVTICDFQGELTALFLDSDYGNGDYHTCYSQYGQHGDCDLEYILGEATPPTIDGFYDLMNELSFIGYEDLEPVALPGQRLFLPDLLLIG